MRRSGKSNQVLPGRGDGDAGKVGINGRPQQTILELFWFPSNLSATSDKAIEQQLRLDHSNSQMIYVAQAQTSVVIEKTTIRCAGGRLGINASFSASVSFMAPPEKRIIRQLAARLQDGSGV